MNNASLAPNGEPYVTVVSGGIKSEGECAPCLCFSPEAAIRLWWDAARDYAFGQRAKAHAIAEGAEAYPPGESAMPLYWRILPEIGEHVIYQRSPVDPEQMDPVTVYIVYSRFLVPSTPSAAVVALQERLRLEGKI